MKTVARFAVLTFICAFGSSLLRAQDKNWKKALEEKLEKGEYAVTTFDSSRRTSIKVPGAVLTVRQAGIPAASGIMIRFARVRNGQITNPQSGPRVGVAYVCKIGEQLYVRDVDVDDDKIDFTLVTVESIQGAVNGADPEQRYAVAIRFEFDKGFLATAGLEQITKAISPVLVTHSQVMSTKTIELGQTFEQVEAVLGKPDTVAKLGDKTTYVYKALKVVFTAGKVTDVQ
jgi:hypothetical protein